MLNYSDGRVTLSPEVTRKASFKPGNRVAIIVNSPKSFDVVPANSSDDTVYSVDMYGRLRISESLLRKNGVRVRRNSKRHQVSSSKGRIVVNL